MTEVVEVVVDLGASVMLVVLEAVSSGVADILPVDGRRRNKGRKRRWRKERRQRARMLSDADERRGSGSQCGGTGTGSGKKGKGSLGKEREGGEHHQPHVGSEASRKSPCVRYLVLHATPPPFAPAQPPPVLLPSASERIKRALSAS